MKAGPGDRRSHRNSACLLCFSFRRMVLLLCGRRHRYPGAVPQWLVYFTAHPQVMQQHRQLSCRGHDGSFLRIPSSALGQLQSPAAQIAVRPKRSQNVLRSLYQQRSQIGIPFLADVHLRLPLPRVPSSRLQPEIAAHVAALAQYQLDRSPKSKPVVSCCWEKFLICVATPVLIFFIAGLLYLLRFERVDNLGAYSIPFGDRPSPSKTLCSGGSGLKCD